MGFEAFNIKGDKKMLIVNKDNPPENITIQNLGSTEGAYEYILEICNAATMKSYESIQLGPDLSIYSSFFTFKYNGEFNELPTGFYIMNLIVKNEEGTILSSNKFFLSIARNESDINKYNSNAEFKEYEG